MRPDNLARAAVLGLACAIASAIDDLAATGIPPVAITMAGGGAKCLSLRHAVADMTGIDVHWPDGFEFAARGAARQAAWALTGELPQWGRPTPIISMADDARSWVDPVREAHAAAVNHITGAS
jgi:xylulokinase